MKSLEMHDHAGDRRAASDAIVARFRLAERRLRNHAGNFPLQLMEIFARCRVARGALAKICPILLLLAAPALWQWTPLHQWANIETIERWQQSAAAAPSPFYLVMVCYLAGGLVLFPVTLLNVATVFTFGPLMGSIYALAGWLASGAMGFGIGRLLGRDVMRALGSRFQKLTQPAENHGFLTVLTLRLLPVAPFTLVNFFVGAARIRFWHFVSASIVGRIPGMIMLGWAGIQMRDFLRGPGFETSGMLLLILFGFPIATAWLSRRAGFTWPVARRPEEITSEPSNSLVS